MPACEEGLVMCHSWVSLQALGQINRLDGGKIHLLHCVKYDAEIRRLGLHGPGTRLDKYTNGCESELSCQCHHALAIQNSAMVAAKDSPNLLSVVLRPHLWQRMSGGAAAGSRAALAACG